jgi:hypothetical protein
MFGRQAVSPAINWLSVSISQSRLVALKNDDTLWQELVSLAADGSLWYWSDPACNPGSLMQPSRQPKLIETIIAAQ